MITKTEQFNKSQLKQLPDIKPGDVVKVHQKIKEGDPSSPAGSSGQVKERMQIFEGLVIAKKHGRGISSTITVRKVVEGVGVERIFPIHSPFIDKIEIISSGKTRRAKLYYLRTAKGIKARLKRKNLASAAAPVLDANVSENTDTEKASEATEVPA